MLCYIPTRQPPTGTHSFPVGTWEQLPQKSYAAAIWGLTKSPSGPASSLVELNRNMYFLAWHSSHSVGVLTAAASPDVGKDFFFSALFLVIFGSYFAFFAALEHWVALFHGTACGELVIPDGNGQSPALSVQHVCCLLPPAPLYQHTSPSADVWPGHIVCHPLQLTIALADLPNFTSLGNFVALWLTPLLRLPVVNGEECSSHSKPLQSFGHFPHRCVCSSLVSYPEPFIHSSTFPVCPFSVRPFGEGFYWEPLQNLERVPASPLSMCLLTAAGEHWWGRRMNHLVCPADYAVLYAI